MLKTSGFYARKLTTQNPSKLNNYIMGQLDLGQPMHVHEEDTFKSFVVACVVA